jgi:hypothetical protein
MDVQTNILGFAAAAATLMTFAQSETRALRLWAICANGLFIAYGWLGGHLPVLLLHFVLMPINVRMLLAQRSNS